MDLTFPKEILNSEGPLKNQTILNISPIHGGSIHNAWRLELKTGQIFFAKTAAKEAFDMLQFESNGLTKLKENLNEDFLTVPKPIIVQKLESSSILLMDWLELSDGDESKLGKGLALLHKRSSNQHLNSFGWNENGFIGYNPQICGWRESWGECFVHLRLAPQSKMAQKWGLSLEMNLFYSKLIKYLERHNPIPCVVHGDLWRGNAAITKNGKGIIFDPAVWWADREVDIAMTTMFGGFSNKFYESYQKTWALQSGFEERIEIYNLYHLLNHANMFGGTYQDNALSSIKKVNSLLN